MTIDKIKKQLREVLDADEATQEDLNDSNAARPLDQSALYINAATSEWALRTKIEKIIQNKYR